MSLIITTSTDQQNIGKVLEVSAIAVGDTLTLSGGFAMYVTGVLEEGGELIVSSPNYVISVKPN